MKRLYFSRQARYHRWAARNLRYYRENRRWFMWARKAVREFSRFVATGGTITIPDFGSLTAKDVTAATDETP